LRPGKGALPRLSLQGVEKDGTEQGEQRDGGDSQGP
jgi:hypothetical protein